MSLIGGILRFDGGETGADDLRLMAEVLSSKPHDSIRQWSDGLVDLVSLPLQVTLEDTFDEQPLKHAESKTRIVFDGRLDNRQALVASLALNREDAPRRPDSYFALQAYLKWGADCCQHLLGDYAFVIWDARNFVLALFRDPIGLRPLYYTQTGEYFAFASHSAALRTLPGVDASLDESWLADFLCFTHHRVELTAYRGIRKLQSAHYLLVKASGMGKPVRYWSLCDEQRDLRTQSIEDCHAEFLALLQVAVEARLRGSQPVASMFSGGLDSSALTALACNNLQAQGRPLIAVSSVLADDHVGEEADERVFIDAMLQKYPYIDWRPVSARGQTVFTEMESLLFACDQPIRDVFYFMTHALMREGGESGARTLLTGFGGDCFASAKLNEALLDMLLQGSPAVAVRTCLQEASMQGLSPARALRNAFIGSLRTKLGRKRQALSADARARSALPAALDKALCHRAEAHANLLEHHRQLTPGFFSTQADDAAMLSSGEMAEGLTSLVLMGKSVGLDVVMPLLDRELIGYCVNLPLSARRHGGLPRSLLRYATQGFLPQVVSDRTCKGAYIPDQTRRVYATVADVLPQYTECIKQHPPWIDISAVQIVAQGMAEEDSGFNQSTSPLTGVIVPLLAAEFYDLRWSQK